MKALNDLEQAGFHGEEAAFIRMLFSEEAPIGLPRHFPLHSLAELLKEVGATGIKGRHLEWLTVLRDVMKATGLNTLSVRLIRAIELIAMGESIVPVGYAEENWTETDEKGIYRHRSLYRLTREGLTGPIFIVDRVHHFATPNYSLWQGYGQMRLMRRDEFPYDPFTPCEELYYEETWDGRGSLDDKLKTATLMHDATFADGWLSIHRTAFPKDEARRNAIRNRILQESSDNDHHR